jgi:translation initiation factor 2B subunit (eIF-2B alpha/beta/delta family)
VLLTFPDYFQVVASALARAATSGKKEFHVYLTKSGECTKRLLEAASIRTTLIEDLAIGYIMNKVPYFQLRATCTALSKITIFLSWKDGANTMQ